MSLYTRLMGIDLPKISVHSFMAALGEVERGKITEAEIAALYSLDAAQQAELAVLVSKIVVPQETICFGGQQVLTNVGAAFDTVVVGGAALVQLAGITRVTFGVRVNRIGTGTQDWQLWRTDTNGTNGVQVGLISDGSGTGVKDLSTNIDFDPALSPGLKILRVRARSSTAADDPVFYGASLLVRRVSRLTSTEIHEVLCLAREGQRYNDETSLKSRLGVGA